MKFFSRADVDRQNDKEREWSLQKLCSTIRREGNGAPLTTSQRAATRPVVWYDAWYTSETAIAVYEARDCHYNNKPFVGSEPIYTGKLCDYWRVLLGGVPS